MLYSELSAELNFEFQNILGKLPIGIEEPLFWNLSTQTATYLWSLEIIYDPPGQKAIV